MLYYLSLFKLSFLAATILPLGSEPYFVFLLTKDELNPVLLLTCATVGNSLGSMTTYLMARILPLDRVIKLFGIKNQQIEKIENSFLRRGGLFSFFCWVPFVGDVLAVFYGFKKFAWLTFLVFMTLGKFLRYFVIYLGLF